MAKRTTTAGRQIPASRQSPPTEADTLVDPIAKSIAAEREAQEKATARRVASQDWQQQCETLRQAADECRYGVGDEAWNSEELTKAPFRRIWTETVIRVAELARTFELEQFFDTTPVEDAVQVLGQEVFSLALEGDTDGILGRLDRIADPAARKVRATVWQFVTGIGQQLWEAKRRAELRETTGTSDRLCEHCQQPMTLDWDAWRCSGDCGSKSGKLIEWGEAFAACHSRSEIPEVLMNSPLWVRANSAAVTIYEARECLAAYQNDRPGKIHDLLAELMGKESRGWYTPVEEVVGLLERRAVSAGDSINSVKKERFCHSPDFASVVWCGAQYSFTGIQAACVKLLWENWENGTPSIRQETIQELADVSQELRHVFREHPAWNKVIVPGTYKGHFRLAEDPSPEKNDQNKVAAK